MEIGKESDSVEADHLEVDVTGDQMEVEMENDQIDGRSDWIISRRWRVSCWSWRRKCTYGSGGSRRWRRWK